MGVVCCSRWLRNTSNALDVLDVFDFTFLVARSRRSSASSNRFCFCLRCSLDVSFLCANLRMFLCNTLAAFCFLPSDDDFGDSGMKIGDVVVDFLTDDVALAESS